MTDNRKHPKVSVVGKDARIDQTVMEGIAPVLGGLEERPVRESGKRRHRPIGKDDLPKR